MPRRLPRLASPAQLGHQDHRERKELSERLEPQDRQDGVELMVSPVTKESRARLDHPGSRDSKECPESREPLPRKKAAPSRESPDRPERRDLKAPQENQELLEMTAVLVSFSLFQLIKGFFQARQDIKAPLGRMVRREMLEQRVEKDQLEHTESRERRASAPGIVQQMEEYSSKMEPGDKRGRIKMLQRMSEIH